MVLYFQIKVSSHAPQRFSGAKPPVNARQSVGTTVDNRKGSRRRGEELERAILQAALDELADVGYPGLTMERVAIRARTSKTVLYRRWAGRAELVVDACKIGSISDVDIPDTGALRTDVIALLRQMSAKMATPFGSILRGLLAEMTRDPELGRLIRERVHKVGSGPIHTILERAAERGEVDRPILNSRRAAVAPDLLRNHFLLFGAPVDDEVVIDIVDEVYLPLVLRPDVNSPGRIEASTTSD
ncbi:TetR/AcrR family transcriptional regulator [Nocardia sp. NPDC051570]|uniref:TetR/AcrR family transcriptional regulator n=1 Tax=Nocardia sp. NPDC051570 TaxID=3364324 RepID=UPI0037926794